MRIGVDCLAVDPAYRGGVNTYIFGLLDGFSELNTENKYIIFCTSKNKKPFKKYLKFNNFDLIVIDNYRTLTKKLFLGIAYAFNSLWLWRKSLNFFVSIKKIDKLIESKCDALYTATTTLNFYNLRVPTILSMHDIQQYHYPDFFTRRELRSRRLTFENSAKYATFFQASSQFIKDDLLDNFPWLKQEKIVVIPEGVNIDEFSKSKETDIIKRCNLPDDFLFFPAQLWKHKNHITVLRSLKKIENEKGLKIPLVMTGAKYSSSNEVLNYIKLNDMDYIFYLGKVDFKDLLTLYKKAKFLITAVLYESSSLPILEASASGTPIIASKTPPNIEMSSNIEMTLFEPLNIEDCASVIEKCWEMKVIDQIDHNNKSIENYNWKNIGKKYMYLIMDRVSVKQ
jgi:glycosyltransferase involved in cell wall biosynthesis